MRACSRLAIADYSQFHGRPMLLCRREATAVRTHGVLNCVLSLWEKGGSGSLATELVDERVCSVSRAVYPYDG